MEGRVGVGTVGDTGSKCPGRAGRCMQFPQPEAQTITDPVMSCPVPVSAPVTVPSTLRHSGHRQSLFFGPS